MSAVELDGVTCPVTTSLENSVRGVQDHPSS
jgi:hypothetical protein